MGVLRSIQRRLVEALGGSLLGDVGAVTSDDPDLQGFRPITDRMKQRDLDQLSHAQMVKLSLYLYSSNNLAKWLVNTPVALAVGRSVPYSIEVDSDLAAVSKGAPTSPEEVQRLTSEIRSFLDRFWEHPTHDICNRADRYAKTFLVTGHLVLPVAEVNAVSGVPQLDLIDAGQIQRVLAVEGSSIMPDTIVYSVPASGEVEGRRLRVIRPNREGTYLPQEPDERGLRGALYFAHSSLLNSMQGVSYLMDVADWLDALDQGTWTSLDRAKLRNAIIWHLTVEGADTPEKINSEVQKLTGALASPGNVYGSNERIKLEAKRSQIEAGDTVDLHRLIRNHVLGSKSMPETWYGEGGYTNRATSSDQTDVAYKALGELQAGFRSIFRTLLWFGYDSIQAKQRRLPFRPESPWLRLEPMLPTVQERDTSRQTAAVAQLVTAFETAIATELISTQTARATFLALVGKIAAVPIELDSEVQRIELESEERQKAEAERANRLVRDTLRTAAGAGEGPGSAETGDGDPTSEGLEA